MGVFTAARRKPKRFPFAGNTGQRAGSQCLAVVVVVPLTPSPLALHASPCPCITTSWGPDFPRSFESRGGPVCHPFGDTSCQVHIRSQAAAPTARERCHAQGEIYSSSPLQTPHLARCRADSSSFPPSATSSSSSSSPAARVGCLGLLRLSPPGQCPSLADGQRQTKGSFPKPAPQGRALVLTQSLRLSDVLPIYFCQGDKNTSLLPTPSAYEKSQLCARRDALCVCVYI